MSGPNVGDCFAVPQQLYDVEAVAPMLGLTSAALSGTAAVSVGSPTVTFSAAQTLSAGTLLTFSSQPNASYTVATSTTTSTTATLTANYLGPTNALATVNAVASLAGTVSLTNGSRAITFSVNQTLALGTQFMFSSQPGVWYVLQTAIAAGVAGTIATAYTGVTSGAATTLAAAALVGTVSLTNASVAITFSQVQTLAEGTALIFSSQPNTIYSLAAAIVAAAGAALTTNYTGATAAGIGTIAGVNDYIPTKAIAARGVLCSAAGTLICDTYGAGQAPNGTPSGTQWSSVPLAAGQNIAIALTRIHWRGTTGSFVAVY
jgi:hypothetical protein